MAIRKTATLTGDALTLRTETDQVDKEGQPFVAVTESTFYGATQIARHLADADMLAHADRLSAGKRRERDDLVDALRQAERAAAIVVEPE